MKHAKLLDCTLRDGAYLIDKQFGERNIHGIINGLNEASIDIIEIGFLQDEGQGEGKTVYKNAKEAEKYVPRKKGNSMYAVLADYSRYSICNLDEYTGSSIDVVRACFFKKERYDVIDFCKEIKKKGYKLFVQPVDILGYTDGEILGLLELINEVEPYCFSIVDTFGSMYADDLQRVFALIHHNLIPGCKIGFHSHNNMQMSNALSQQFLQMSYGMREVVVDTTISGMGRGAGNTPTELVAQYMVTKLGYNYNIDSILDIIDTYLDNIRTKCSWGYSTPYFIAGAYSAHVNNISYLTKKATIHSKDIRYILNRIGEKARKRYDYELLENTYVDYLNSGIDDKESIKKLRDELQGEKVLVLATGSTLNSENEKIVEWIKANKPKVISVNFWNEDLDVDLDVDYVFISNIKRFKELNEKLDKKQKRIITSNIKDEKENDYLEVSFVRLVKCGWENMENSAVMLLRLLDLMDVESIALAGIDGYGNEMNYFAQDYELSSMQIDYMQRNREIQEMLTDYMSARQSNAKIEFITKSRFRL